MVSSGSSRGGGLLRRIFTPGVTCTSTFSANCSQSNLADAQLCHARVFASILMEALQYRSGGRPWPTPGPRAQGRQRSCSVAWPKQDRRSVFVSVAKRILPPQSERIIWVESQPSSSAHRRNACYQFWSAAVEARTPALAEQPPRRPVECFVGTHRRCQLYAIR